jgi:hypothetical protein
LLVWFVVQSLFAKVEANWPAVAFFGLAVLAVREADSGAISRRWMPAALYVGAAAAVVAHVHCLTGLLPFPAGTDPTDRLRRGGQGLARALLAARDDLWTGGGKRFGARGYGLAASVSFDLSSLQDRLIKAYYVKDPRRASQFDLRPWAEELSAGDDVVLITGRRDDPMEGFPRAFGEVVGPKAVRVPAGRYDGRERVYWLRFLIGYRPAGYRPSAPPLGEGPPGS